MDETLRTLLARLESKIDQLDDKLDRHREDYLPRVGQLEYRVGELEKAADTKGTRRFSTKQLSGVAGLSAFLAFAVDYLKTLFGG